MYQLPSCLCAALCTHARTHAPAVHTYSPGRRRRRRICSRPLPLRTQTVGIPLLEYPSSSASSVHGRVSSIPRPGSLSPVARLADLPSLPPFPYLNPVRGAGAYTVTLPVLVEVGSVLRSPFFVWGGRVGFLAERRWVCLCIWLAGRSTCFVSWVCLVGLMVEWQSVKAVVLASECREWRGESRYTNVGHTGWDGKEGVLGVLKVCLRQDWISPLRWSFGGD